jgi:hypothetical protein
MSKFARRPATALLVLAVSLVAVSSLPSLAAAKSKSKPLTKSAVIKLIEQYSKPGPQGQPGGQGKQGTPGPAGSYTIGSGSGLQLKGAALSVDSGLFGGCPAGEVMNGLSASGSGSRDCSYGLQYIDLERSGFDTSDPTDPTPTTVLMDTSTTVVSAVAQGAVKPGDYYVNAAIELLGETLSSPDLVKCLLVDVTTNTVYRSVADSIGGNANVVDGYANLEIQDAIPVAPGDRLDINCLHDGGTGTDFAAGTLTVMPVG